MNDLVEFLRARAQLLPPMIGVLVGAALGIALFLGLMWLTTKGVVGVECGKGGSC